MKTWIGEFRKSPTQPWTEDRLAETGSGLTPVEARAALDFYAGTFLPVKGMMPVSFWKKRWRKKGPTKHIQTTEEELQWHPTAMCFPTYEVTLRPSHLPGVLWRGALAHTLGSGEPVERERLHDLFTFPSVRRLKCLKNSDLRRLFGSEAVATAKDLRVADSACWWWCFPSEAEVRHVVVDLDVHHDGDQETLAARLVLLMALKMKPHLIVRSRNGLGLHVYYLVDQQSLQSQAYAVATSIRHALNKRVPGIVRDGIIEVFPKGMNRQALMPPYPFGPNSFLCNRRGEVIESHPLLGLRRWMTEADACQRYTADDFNGLRVGPVRSSVVEFLTASIVAQKNSASAKQKNQPASFPSATSSSLSPEATSESNPTKSKASQPVPASTIPLPSASASTSKLLAACERLQEWPPARGSTNALLKMLARFLRYDCQCDLKRALEVLDCAMAPLVDAKHTSKEYRSRFRALYAKAEFPVFTRTSSGQPAVRIQKPVVFDLLLTPRDVETIGRLLAKRLPKSLLRRKVVMQLWLLIVGTARRSGMSSGLCAVPDLSRHMQRISRDYSDCFPVLKDFGRVRDDITGWRVQVPKTDGKPVPVTSHAELWPFIVKHLPDEIGKVIAGTRNWPLWKRRRAEGSALI